MSQARSFESVWIMNCGLNSVQLLRLAREFVALGRALGRNLNQIRLRRIELYNALKSKRMHAVDLMNVWFLSHRDSNSNSNPIANSNLYA